MKLLFRRFKSILAPLLLATLQLAVVQSAQAQGYGYGNPRQGPPPGGVPTPSAPLAGGRPAANGDEFIDVRGNQIVMPVQYAQQMQYADEYGQGCPPGGACGAGGGADGMYADFGGYGQDQIGPHYFDVAFDAVFLYGEDRYESTPANFSSAGRGLGAPRLLNADSLSDDITTGWQATIRYDLGPLSVLEATYMGLYDVNFSSTVRSEAVTNPSIANSLFSVFSNFGTTGTDLPGLDNADVQTLSGFSDLQSTEFSYRRYWVGFNPRVTGTLLGGFRYVRYTDELNFASQGATGAANLNWSGENDLLGGQIGGDMWIGLRQGLRLGFENKAGVYNNRYTFDNRVNVPPGVGSPGTFALAEKGNQVAFVGESSVNLVADILPSLSIRGGYRVLYLNSLATAGDNVNTTSIITTTVGTQSDAIFHGFNAGFEYIW